MNRRCSVVRVVAMGFHAIMCSYPALWLALTQFFSDCLECNWISLYKQTTNWFHPLSRWLPHYCVHTRSKTRHALRLTKHEQSFPSSLLFAVKELVLVLRNSCQNVSQLPAWSFFKKGVPRLLWQNHLSLTSRNVSLNARRILMSWWTPRSKRQFSFTRRQLQ